MTITMSRAHSPSFPSLHLCHNSFSNPSVASPTSQLILQPFFRFSYVTGFSLTSPGEPPMIYNYIKSLWISVIFNFSSFLLMIAKHLNPPEPELCLSGCYFYSLCLYISSGQVFRCKLRLQFCPKAGLPLQIQEPNFQFYYAWIDTVASRCFSHPTLPLAWQTLKELKRSQ